MPAEIRQEDNQLVKYFDTHTVTSIYPTTTQTSTFSLGVPNVESFSKKSPYAFSGTDLVFGPYTDVGAGAGASFSNLDIHYENNAPFAKAKEAIREIEVSHWGNVAFEEYLEVVHAGAKLTGGFSRIDFQMRRAPASFQGLVAMLPPGAKNIYYRDQIGNISTSSVRHRPQGVELGIESRFPLFGGWKTQFYQGYSVPVQELLTVANGNRYSLTVPFSVPYSEVWVEELTVKVVLPEWATDLKVELPFEVDEEEQVSRLTYLDTSLSGGRPVVVLKKRNVVAEHIQPMVVSYTFPKRAMLLEPLYLVLAFFIFFVVCMVFVRVDLRILANGSSQASSASLNKKKQ
jgi:oligosaccharyltransferase complex subunit alpha (ribophorin I)